jgi:hypothetical protein
MSNRTCEHCADTFSKLTDYMIHYHQQHLGRVDIRRTLSCWACAGQIHPDAETCKCGWVRTDAHKYGTQNTNKGETK